MMMSPEIYLENHVNDTYKKLIRERKRLQREIYRLEKCFFGDVEMSEEEKNMSPEPDTMYQMSLSYLSVLCDFMREKYNKEIVDKNLEGKDNV